MSAAPEFSVVIPALDEEAVLRATIQAARAALGAHTEIVVADGGSRDATCELARTAGARVVYGRRGRGTQLRVGAEQCRGDVIVLLHADTLLPAGAGAAIRTALRDRQVVGGAFRIAFTAGPPQRLPRRLRAYARWLNARSRWLGMMTGDQAIFARAAALRAAGGVPDVPLFEDVRLQHALRGQGRLTLLDCAVATSPRLFLRRGALRTIGLHLGFRVLHAAGVTPERLARWYPASGPADW